MGLHTALDRERTVHITQQHNAVSLPLYITVGCVDCCVGGYINIHREGGKNCHNVTFINICQKEEFFLGPDKGDESKECLNDSLLTDWNEYKGCSSLLLVFFYVKWFLKNNLIGHSSKKAYMDLGRLSSLK